MAPCPAHPSPTCSSRTLDVADHRHQAVRPALTVGCGIPSIPRSASVHATSRPPARHGTLAHLSARCSAEVALEGLSAPTTTGEGALQTRTLRTLLYGAAAALLIWRSLCPQTCMCLSACVEANQVNGHATSPTSRWVTHLSSCYCTDLASVAWPALTMMWGGSLRASMRSDGQGMPAS